MATLFQDTCLLVLDQGSVIIFPGAGAGSVLPPTSPYSQMAEYLSERGYAVLRYDKRGVGPNFTISDSNAWGNLTFDNLKQDAEKALAGTVGAT